MKRTFTVTLIIDTKQTLQLRLSLFILIDWPKPKSQNRLRFPAGLPTSRFTTRQNLRLQSTGTQKSSLVWQISSGNRSRHWFAIFGQHVDKVQ